MEYVRSGNRNRYQKVSFDKRVQLLDLALTEFIEGVKRGFYATDNYTWPAPGETRELTLEVLWREEKKPTTLSIYF